MIMKLLYTFKAAQSTKLRDLYMLKESFHNNLRVYSREGNLIIVHFWMEHHVPKTKPKLFLP
jgi:hypothetical protein